MTPKLLYVGMQYDYGDRRRGLSYEHRNFYDSLHRFCQRRGWEMVHYDFMERGRLLGREAMTEELFALATGTDFAALFAVLFDPDRDPVPEVFSRIGEIGRTRTVHWFCDDHWKFDTYSRHLAPHFHFSCTTAQTAVEKYGAIGLGDRVIKTQWACNHHLYVPGNLSRDVDLSFVGMPHGNRRQVLAGLAAAGMVPEIYGFGWKGRPRLPFHRMVRLFSRSRINLNLSNASAEQGQQIKGRNFEIPGCGGFQLSSDAENLTEYYAEDREIVIFRSDEELVDKVRYYLAHEAEREAIARNAYDRTLAEHTWQHRLNLIFDRMGVERKEAPSASASKATAPANSAAAPVEASVQFPWVSVIIPCYDHAHYLAEAVASVAAQTYPNLDVVIVNDGSPDDTSAVARTLMARYADLPITLVEQANAGLAAARNAGVAASKGTYWLPLDADDRIAPTFVEKCVRTLESLPAAGFAYTDIHHFGDLDTVFRLPAFDAETMVHRNNIGCVCSLVRRSVWEAVGGYDPCMRQGYEDWDFWVGCIEKGWTGVHIADPLFFYRKHGDSMLTDARKKHDLLFARIVLNHSLLYGVEEIQAAARTIAEATRAAIAAPETATVDPKREKLTITYLIHSVLGVTGGNQTLVRQTNELVRRGHRVNIVTYSEKPAWFDLGANLIRVPAGEPTAGHVPPSDVVIATYFLNAPELLRIEAPVRIYFAQGDQYIFGDNTPIADAAARAERERLRRLCAESYRLPGIRFVANSYNLAATVGYRTGRLADAILPPCRDQTVFHPLDRAPAPPWRILVVGPDARGSDAEPLTFKGIGDIREALDLLGGQPPFQVVRMSNTTADIFKGYPCEFHFKPAARKKTEIFGTAHILIYASHYDSCPLPPMEGMAAGAAVVCTATPGALEYCRHEKNCLLVPVGSPEAIAGAVRRIMGDDALYRRLIDGGLATAAQYPREREWNELEQLLYRFADQADNTDDHRRDDPPPMENSSQLPPVFAVGSATVSNAPSGLGTDNDQKESPMNPQQTTHAADASADEALRRIHALIENERFDAAVSALNRLLDDHPDHAEAHGELGRLHHSLGEPDQAAIHLERAVGLAPDRVDFQRNLADFYHVARGRGDQALAIYESLAAAYPQDPEVSLMAGHLSVGLHRFAEAGDHYRRVLAIDPDHGDAARYLETLERRAEALHGDETPQERHARAQKLAGDGRTDEAVAVLEALASDMPDHVPAHNDLGELYYQKGDKDRAHAHYQKAADLAPEDLTLKKNLADFLHVERGDVAGALKIYVEILAQKPDDVETLLTTGHICVSHERFDDAAHFYRRVLEAEPWHGDARRFLDAVDRRIKNGDDPQALRDRATALLQPGTDDVPGAIAALKQAATMDPDHGETFSRLGELLHQTGETEQARVHLETAARLAPDDVEIQKRLADFYYVALGRTTDALAIYEAVSDAHPEDVTMHMLTGHLNVALGRLDAAETRYRQVLRLEPWHADAGQYIDALVRNGDGAGGAACQDPDAVYRSALEKAEVADEAGAMKILETLVAAHPDHALAHNDLGVLYSRQQQGEKALTHYRKAVALEPASTVFQKNLADCYAGTMNRFQDALEIYVNLLAADPYEVEALTATGQVCAALGQPDDARHFFNRALEAEPWNADARTLLDALEKGVPASFEPSPDELLHQARQLAEAGDATGALETLKGVVASNPDHAPAHNDLGVTYYRLGDADRAEHHYTRAVALAPADALYRKNLADFYCMGGRVEAALEIYVNLLAADPYDVEVLLAMGQVCMALGQPDDAGHFFNRALEAEPWNADARQLLDQLANRQTSAAC
ncbi:MAG: tetratricopeptide repeat protein [Desulfobacterales bacterium]|nr:tetratricopeptide repeat protein [Desulfobacterales bacterium]